MEKTILKRHYVLKDSTVDVSPHSFPEEGKSEWGFTGRSAYLPSDPSLFVRNLYKIFKVLHDQKILAISFPIGLYLGCSSMALCLHLFVWRNRRSYVQQCSRSPEEHRFMLSPGTGGLYAEHVQCMDALRLMLWAHLPCFCGFRSQGTGPTWKLFFFS